MFAVSADNSTCVNRTLQWRWLETQKFSNASVIDLQKKKLPAQVYTEPREYIEFLGKGENGMEHLYEKALESAEYIKTHTKSARRSRWCWAPALAS